tara:strand:- start:6659 stop:7327 length:669 start_codon:yes stop_codon:yes gene_type:complete
MNALPFGYRPLGWNAGLTAQDYLAHMKAEFDRLSINLPDDLRQFREVWHGLSEREEQRPWIHKYVERAIQEASANGDKDVAPADFGFGIYFYLNQLRNFTMRWEPDYETLKRFGIRGDYAEIYGGRRPLNEFIHLKSMNYVAYPIAGKHLWGKSRKPTSDECFVSDIICCLRKQVEEFSREASRSYKVEVHSKFKFKLEDRVLSRSATEVESLVVDWEIEQL